jgi:coenzyme PQQ precursor peptide PqqA
LDLIERNRQYRFARLRRAPSRLAAWVNPAEEPRMQWHAPKLVEIACGCEINAYFPADL